MHSIASLPVISFPRIPEYPEDEVELPERPLLRALIDRYGHDISFRNRHSAFVSDTSEALIVWLPKYKAGYPKPGLHCRVPEQIGWLAWIKYRAALALELPESNFWAVIYESSYRNYLERVIGRIVMDDDSIERRPYISPKKWLQCTYSLPKYKSLPCEREIRRHLEKTQKITGVKDSRRFKFSEYEDSLWREIEDHPNPEIKAIRDEFKAYLASLIKDHPNRPPRPIATFCPFCGDLSVWTPKQGVSTAPRSCGKQACETAYGTQKTEKYRKAKGPVPTRATTWVKAKERGTCRACKKRKNVNIEGFCFTCS
jgi:hypothetical protein